MNKENGQIPEITWEENGTACSTDRSKLDIALVHRFLTNEAYWAKGRSLEQVRRSIEHSLCFGIYRNKKQLGFARVVTDFTVAFPFLGQH
jgi:hypothetical protein